MPGRGFVPAKLLATGALVASLIGQPQTLSASQWSIAPKTVYNFEVENTHTYFVGQNSVWVHNSCKWEVSKIAPDWLVKGAHIKINNVELKVFKGASGKVEFQAVFSSTPAGDVAKATKAAKELLAKDPKFLTKLSGDVDRAIPYLQGLNSSIVNKAQVIQDLQDLSVILKGLL